MCARLAVSLLLCSIFAHAGPMLGSGYSSHPVQVPYIDPFYVAPTNIASYHPGAIIRSRTPPNPVALFGFGINLENAWQLLYRTTGANGEALATVTTVLVPHNADYSTLLSYQAEIDAPYDGCFPSITLQQPGQNLDNIASQYGELWMVSALDKGWVVAVPDHEGPQAAFGASLIGGYAALDGLRAVLRSSSVTGIDPAARIAVWGYSGGAMATEFALELKAQYAPELNITAAAAGGLPVSLNSSLHACNGDIGAGLVVNGLLGLAKAYPRFDDILQARLFPNNKSTLLAAEHQCLISTAAEFAFQDISRYLKGGESFLQLPLLQEILSNNHMGYRRAYNTPTYFYQAVNDEIAPFAEVEALYAKYCAASANIQFIKDAAGEHATTALLGAAGALQFLMDRMNDIPLRPGCSTRTVVSSALEPSSLPVLGGIVYSAIAALLGLTGDLRSGRNNTAVHK